MNSDDRAKEKGLSMIPLSIGPNSVKNAPSNSIHKRQITSVNPSNGKEVVTNGQNSYSEAILEEWKRSATVAGSFSPTGWSLPTPFSSWAAKLTLPPYSRTYTYPSLNQGKVRAYGDTAEWRTSIGPGPHFRFWGTKSGVNGGTSRDPDVTQSMKDASLTRALAKFQDMDINLSVSLAEGRKTVNMIADRVKTLMSAWKQFRRGNMFAVARILGTRVHNTWLEYRYGWLPLMSDIYGGAQALKNLGEDLPPAISVSSELQEDYPHPRLSGSSIAYALETDGTCKIGCKTILWATPNSKFLQILKSLGLNNPALILWELVPLSFVVDWFLPIGTWLAALGGTLGLDFLSGTRTSYSQVKLKVQYELGTSGYGAPIGGSKPLFYTEVESCQRECFYTWPYGPLYIQSPFSSRRTLDAVALIRAANRK